MPREMTIEELRRMTVEEKFQELARLMATATPEDLREDTEGVEEVRRRWNLLKKPYREERDRRLNSPPQTP